MSNLSSQDKETIRKMRRGGKEWSEVEEWVTRQVGYDKEILDLAKEIYRAENVYIWSGPLYPGDLDQ